MRIVVVNQIATPPQSLKSRAAAAGSLTDAKQIGEASSNIGFPATVIQDKAE